MGKKKKIDIYNRKKRKKSAEKGLNESWICQRNKNLILEFLDYKTNEGGISILRRNKYLSKLRILAEHLKKPFDEATKDDIKELLNEIYSMDIKRGEKGRRCPYPAIYLRVTSSKCDILIDKFIC